MPCKKPQFQNGPVSHYRNRSKPEETGVRPHGAVCFGKSKHRGARGDVRTITNQNPLHNSRSLPIMPIPIGRSIVMNRLLPASLQCRAMAGFGTPQKTPLFPGVKRMTELVVESGKGGWPSAWSSVPPSAQWLPTLVSALSAPLMLRFCLPTSYECVAR